MIALKHRLASGDPSVKSEIPDLESSLKVLMTEEYVGAKIRSRAKWLEEGETPTKFFLKLASKGLGRVLSPLSLILKVLRRLLYLK